MEEIKCTECGANLKEELKECPNCGCPIKVTEKNETVIQNKSVQNFMPFVSLAIGIIILIMGFTVVSKKTAISTHNAFYHDVPSAAFGADFYTEIYGATDKIADELNDINRGVEVLSNSLNDIAKVIYFSAGMLIIAVGLGTIAFSCIYIKKDH